jgi:hypothetical protein
LAQQGQLAAMLKSKEVGQPVRSYAFSPGGLQQHPVDAAKPRRIIAQHGTGQDVPTRPWDREPSRLAILASALEGGRQNSRAREGTGSGAWCAVVPPNRR